MTVRTIRLQIRLAPDGRDRPTRQTGRQASVAWRNQASRPKAPASCHIPSWFAEDTRRHASDSIAPRSRPAARPTECQKQSPFSRPTDCDTSRTRYGHGYDNSACDGRRRHSARSFETHLPRSPGPRRFARRSRRRNKAARHQLRGARLGFRFAAGGLPPGPARGRSKSVRTSTEPIGKAPNSLIIELNSAGIWNGQKPLGRCAVRPERSVDRIGDHPRRGPIGRPSKQRDPSGSIVSENCW